MLVTLDLRLRIWACENWLWIDWSATRTPSNLDIFFFFFFPKFTKICKPRKEWIKISSQLDKINHWKQPNLLQQSEPENYNIHQSAASQITTQTYMIYHTAFIVKATWNLLRHFIKHVTCTIITTTLFRLIFQQMWLLIQGKDEYNVYEWTNQLIKQLTCRIIHSWNKTGFHAWVKKWIRWMADTSYGKCPLIFIFVLFF